MRIDPPEFTNPGQSYPVTFRYHQVVAGVRSDIETTFQDAGGNVSYSKGTRVDADGTSRSFDLTISSGIANGRVTEKQPGSKVSHTQVIRDMPVQDLQLYTGGFDLHGPASGNRFGFDPNLMTPSERQAWQRNEDIVKQETASKYTAKSSKTPSEAKPRSRQQCANEETACNAGCNSLGSPHQLMKQSVCRSECDIAGKRCRGVEPTPHEVSWLANAKGLLVCILTRDAAVAACGPVTLSPYSAYQRYYACITAPENQYKRCVQTLPEVVP